MELIAKARRSRSLHRPWAPATRAQFRRDLVDARDERRRCRLVCLRGSGEIVGVYSRRHLKIAGQWRDHERWATVAS